MKKLLRKFSSIFAAAAICFAMNTAPAVCASNLPGAAGGNIGDEGTWTTPENLDAVTGLLSHDMDAFQQGVQNQLVPDYVPAEARLGIAFINAMSSIGVMLDRSLGRFAQIFIIIMFVFWVTLEGYQLISGTANTQKTVEGIVKKAVIIAIWMIVLNMGVAKIFMLVMAPVLALGSAISDLILNAVTAAAGASLPDTCAAIHAYTAANISPNAIIDAGAAADLMCVPTRLSGFFSTAIVAGFKWMGYGIGHSALTFLAGLVFVVLFAMAAWKFALMALGVIADLFLAIFMLPFTAVAETTNKTQYKGIPGTIYNGLLDIFKTQSLSTQIQRFIDAVVYFVSLSIVIAVCAAILAGAFATNLASQVPTIEDQGFMITLLIGCLVLYLANKAKEIAGRIGGAINDALGQQFGSDVVNFTKNTYKTAKGWYRAARGK